MSRRMVIPLLNEYKFSLSRRRALQTLFGGARIRKLPWFIHVTQLVLWIAPLVLSIPFIILDALGVWNEYFLALVYGCIMGVSVLIVNVVVFLRRRQIKDTQMPRIEFDDEEESVNISSHFGIDAIDFIFSPKKIFSILHPFFSSLLSFVGCFVLFPSILQESVPIIGIVLISIFGWLTLCNAHYSLSTRPPHEIAVYRATDPLELRFIYRPFYVTITGGILILLRLFSIANFKLLYAVFCLLPLGWMIGFLPSLDALFPWLMELVLTRLLGGSPMATDLRLLIVLVASILSVIVVIPTEDTTSFLLLTAFGFLLSQDIFNSFKAIVCLVTSNPRNRITKFLNSLCNRQFKKMLRSYSGITGIRVISDSHSCRIFLILATLKGIILLVISLGCVYFASTMEISERKLVINIFSGSLIFLAASVFVSDNLQTPYIFVVFRNYSYPKLTGSIEEFKSKIRNFHRTSIPRKIMIIYVLPLLMLIVIGLSLGNNDVSTPRLWQKIVTARLLRKVWQNTQATLYEVAVVSILVIAFPDMWSGFDFPTLALIVGLSLDVMKDFLQKMSFVMKSMISFVYLHKQRLSSRYTALIIAGSLIFSPLIFLLILASSILSAPLLSVFTLPIFSISFPRTQRFWPSLLDYGSTYHKTDETIIYEQAELAVVKGVYKTISCGAASSQPGTQLLLRFDNRLALASILETSYGTCVINIRGLELQETSCHSEEATMVDNIFEALHSPKSCGESLLNKNVLSTLSPVDSVVIHTYSDANNVLTGIIDQPQALHRFSNNLAKVLTWVFDKHFKSHNTESTTDQNAQGEVVETASNEVPEHMNIPEGGPMPDTGAFKHTSGEAGMNIVDETISWNSTESEETLQEHKAEKFGASSIGPMPGHFPADRPLSRRSSQQSIYAKFYQPEHKAKDTQETQPNTKKRSGKVHTAINTSPCCWKRPPLTPCQISELTSRFPYEWYYYLNGNVKEEGSSFKLLSSVVVCCFSVLDVPCQTFESGFALETTPQNIYRGFCGDFCYSDHLNWIKDEPMLWELALKSYRYAVKLMYDEGCLGEVESWDELADYLEEYEQKWCITRETEEAWRTSVLSNTPHLFSIGHDAEKNVHTAHVLSLQDEVVHIGTLNPAALQSIWTDLAIELFYLTNDDEERYSIQAHTNLLRNLSIQTAEPPLGYSIYSSGLITLSST